MSRGVTEDPVSYNFPQVSALGPDKIDNLGRALFSLARELCVLTDRQLVLEKLLQDAGIVAGDTIEHYEPDKTVQAKIDKKMAAIVHSVLGELEGD